MILFDDIGSYPLPKGINREWVAESIKTKNSKFMDIIKDSMKQKIDAGVEIPTYPQFQDMNKQFLDIINDETKSEEPFIVNKKDAEIIELKAIEDIGKEYFNETNKKLNIRLCITGPIELYLNQFGGTAYTDILDSFAVSVSRFISNSIENSKNFDISVISIDEPSIGINPQIMFKDKDIINALTIATEKAGSKDVEIHLHSPLQYKLICDVPHINIIGLESAANPSYIDLIDKKDLEDYNKFVRIGVSRTDIFNMTAALNEKYGINVWKQKDKLKEVVTVMETPQTIENRLKRIYNIFGDKIKYAGPDCGLGSWPSQELAFKLLKNTNIGIKRFYENKATNQ